jgi:hypothetical protein
MKKEVKRMILLNLTLFCFIIFNCTTAKADEPLIYVKAKLNYRHKHYNEITSKYGEVWIGYFVSDIKIPPSEYETFLIEKAYYYFKKDGSYVLLGYIDKTGLYDKNGVCLRPAPTPPLISSDNEIAGINSNMFEYGCFSPTYILRSKTIRDRFIETDYFVAIDINTEQDTLSAFEDIMF